MSLTTPRKYEQRASLTNEENLQDLKAKDLFTVDFDFNQIQRIFKSIGTSLNDQRSDIGILD